MIHPIVFAAALTSLAGAVLGGSIEPPPGPVGPTMKTLQQVEPRLPLDGNTAPGDADALMKISNPGSYYLTANMSTSSGRGLLEIAASDVTVDLNGFRIQGAAGSLDGIFTTGALVNVTIRNGTLSAFSGDGIDTSSAKRVRVENVRVRSCGGSGLRLGDESVAADCEVSANALHGVVLGERSELRDSLVVGSTGGDGVNSASNGVIVHHCTLSGNSGDGVQVSGTAALVTDCMIRENQDSGVSFAGGSTLERSIIAQNGGSGVFLRARDRVANCRISGNTFNGVSLTGAAIVENNEIAENKIHGVSIFFTNGIRNADMIVRGNTINSNGDAAGEYAIYAGNGVFSGTIDCNTARLNQGGIKLVGNLFIVTRNVCGPNHSWPFDFDETLQNAAPIYGDPSQATHPLGNIDNGTFIFGE